MQGKTFDPLSPQKGLRNIIFEVKIIGRVKWLGRCSEKDFRKY